MKATGAFSLADSSILQPFVGHLQFVFLNAPVKLFFRHRLAEQVALQAVAADLVQEFGLGFRFHAFRQRQHIDPVCHLDDAVDQRPGFLAVFQV